MPLTKEQVRKALLNSVSCEEDCPSYRPEFIVRQKDLENPGKVAGIPNPLFTVQALEAILSAYGINPRE